MKLLYVVSDPTLSTSHLTGAATHIISVIKGLEKLGVEIKTVIAGDEQPSGHGIKKLPSLRKFFPLVIRTLKRDISFLLHDRWWVKKVAEEVRYFQPDVIYERTAFLHISVGRIARKLGIPIVMEINSPASEIKFLDGSLLLPLASYMEKCNALLADAVITVSNAMKDYLTSRGAEPQKVYVARNAADKGLFEYKSSTLLEKTHSDIVIGHVSSFANWYRIDILIKAFALVKKLYPKLRLFIIGNGPLRNKLELLAKKSNVSDSVIFTGRKPQREVLDIVAGQVDIAVCTNISWYGSPTKIFEYGAMGKPVIAFRTPAISEIIKHEETGLLVSDNPNELSGAIIRLIKNPELCVTLAKNWQTKVLNEYTWDTVASKTIDICKRILSEKGD